MSIESLIEDGKRAENSTDVQIGHYVGRLGNRASTRRINSVAASIASLNAKSRAGLGRPSKAANLRQRNMALAR